MTTPLRPEISLHDPGDLIAAVPHLLGFHPCESLVLVTLHGPDANRVGLTLRADLPAPADRHALVRQLLPPVGARGATGAWVLVIGGTTDPPDTLPHRDLVTAVGAGLTVFGVPVLHAAWCQRTTAGARWRCYGEPDCAGTVPDPRSSALAAAAAAAGVVTYASREDLAAQLAPDDDAVLARRASRLGVLTAAGDRDRASREVDAARRDLLAVHTAIADAACGRLALSDDAVVRLAMALSDHRVRDACLSSANGPQAEPAERLWLALTRATPAPYRAEPATLLACAAYLRGDGALASIALEHAEVAQPGHRLAGLLRRALDSGLPPERLADIAVDAAADVALLLAEEKPC